MAIRDTQKPFSPTQQIKFTFMNQMVISLKRNLQKSSRRLPMAACLKVES